VSRGRPRRAGRIPFLAATAALAGCATTPQQTEGYVRIDGSEIAAGSAAEAQFETDRAVCLGEMSKAKLGGTVVPTGNPSIDDQAQAEREHDARQVMRGCMAQRGYRME